jgi:homoserine/homoserine lactone efflux protein
MSLDAWLFFVVTETALCFTPGPAVLLIASLSLRGGVRTGVQAGIGIAAANTLYFVLSATGVGALLLASSQLFFLLKWGGAAYLIWLGLKLLLSRPKAAASILPSLEDVGPSGRKAFLHGAWSHKLPIPRR